MLEKYFTFFILQCDVNKFDLKWKHNRRDCDWMIGALVSNLTHLENCFRTIFAGVLSKKNMTIEVLESSKDFICPDMLCLQNVRFYTLLKKLSKLLKKTFSTSHCATTVLKTWKRTAGVWGYPQMPQLFSARTALLEKNILKNLFVH